MRFLTIVQSECCAVTRKLLHFYEFVGAIRTLMDGSGLKGVLETIYGENAVVHMTGFDTDA